MDPERFRFLLDAYGSDSRHWPAEERPAMEAFLAENAEAEVWRREAQALDLALSGYSVESFDLTDRILGSVPRSALEQVLDWLLPEEPRAWWRPAVAAAIPLFLGIAIGITDPAASVSGSTDGDWTAQEQDLLSGSYGSAWYE